MTFDEWVVANAEAIAAARAVSVEDLCAEPGALATQLARVRQHVVSLGTVKADATSWVNKTRALAVQGTRMNCGEYSSNERKVIADADPTYLSALKLKEDVGTTMSALKSMHFEILNDRRTSFVPKAHDND